MPEHEYTAEEIVELVRIKESSQSVQELIEQMDADFDTYSLVAYPAEPNHQSYTSPAPRNDFQKVFHGINKASLTYQIKLPETAPETERDKANMGEQLLTGVLDRIDRHNRKNGEPPLRTGYGWFACSRGMTALKCLIYKDADNADNMTFDIKNLDPRWLRYEKGADGWLWIAYLYHVSKAEARDKWEVDLGDDREDAIVIDFFSRKINALVLYYGAAESEEIEYSQFIKKPQPHGLDHIPIYIGFASGMPTVRGKDNRVALKQQASSVFASSRNVYPAKNKQVSFMLDNQEKAVAGTLIFYSEDGKKMVKGDPYGSWQVIPLKKGVESIEPLQPPKIPQETSTLLDVLDKDQQQSTVPFPIGYGLDPQAHSGAALAMLDDNTRSVYGPYTALMESGWLWLCEEILSQFKQKGETMKLQGFNAKETFFEIEAKPEDIRDDWYIQVKVEPKLPRDESGELQMAIAATAPRRNGRPFMSDFTAYEKIIKLQDPDAEMTRIDDQMLKEKIDQIPSLAIRKMANKLFEAGDNEGAMELLAMMPAPPGAAQGQPAGAPPPAPMGQPGQPGMPPAGMPPGQPGAPQMPPEIMEIINALQQYEATGQPAPPELIAAAESFLRPQ